MHGLLPMKNRASGRSVVLNISKNTPLDEPLPGHASEEVPYGNVPSLVHAGDFERGVILHVLCGEEPLDVRERKRMAFGASMPSGVANDLLDDRSRCAFQTVGYPGDALLRNGVAGIVPKNSNSCARVGERNANVLAQTAGAQNRLIDCIRHIGGAYHDYAFAAIGPVQALEQSVYDFALILFVLAREAIAVSERVHFIDEKYAGCVGLRGVESGAHRLQQIVEVTFGLPSSKRMDMDGNSTCSRQSLRKECFSRPGRTTQQYSSIYVGPKQVARAKCLQIHC